MPFAIGTPIRFEDAVKLVMTLRTRDQVDVVGAVVAFHLNAGVDFVIATDHQSMDGTDEVLESYVRDGVLRLIRVTGDSVQGQAWRTQAARLAATEHGADWTFSCDGDEFWWPRHGSLKDVLSAVPARYGIVEAPWRFFLPRPAGPLFFAERMTVRLSPAAALVHPLSPFKPDVKIAHRALESVVVERGNHRLLAGGLPTLHGWHPIEVLHFPVRSETQYYRRLSHWGSSGRNWWFAPTGAPTSPLPYASLTVDDDMLADGLRRGSLTLDHRLRDTLGALSIRGIDDAERRPGHSLRSDDSVTIGPPPRSAGDELEWIVDTAAMADRGALRLRRRLDDLAARVCAASGRRR